MRPRYWFRLFLLSGASLLPLAGCGKTTTALTAPLPAGTQAAITGDAALAVAQGKIAAQVVATIPNASPTLLRDASCADAAVNALATTVANAASGSSVEQDAIGALVGALQQYATLSGAGGACAGK